ncbi:hypothetical protein [Bacillus paralicheniformis]|uniref:hypothetical protein n=1 Tax=Bacillus paralicheniformis TaxID=1648923 RepID=UPI001F0F8E6F|nr:hypothetical protein [Bacillus paralicheniformis]MCY8038697.1 hypothetical protein [Bacillus paralicheniformis]
MFILFLFFHFKHQFDVYAVWNPNVTDGYMEAGTFVAALKLMIYSGTLFNLALLFILSLLIVILVQSVIFIALEITAYVKIKKDPFSPWGSFILAMGIKSIFTNLSGIPFMAAGFILHKQQEPKDAVAQPAARRKARRSPALLMKKAAKARKHRNKGIKS